MNQLTVAGSAPLTMSSREIAELTGKEPSHVNRDIRAMLDALADDPELDHVREEKDARGYTAAFHLGRELTYTLLAGYSIALRRRVVARWQELEAQQAPALPATYLDALRAHLASEEKAAALAIEVQKKEQALAEAAPKVEFVERYVQASSGALGFRQVCKTLCLNEKWLAEFLELHQVMYRLAGKLTPYQQHIQAGRFEVKTGVSDGGYGYVQPKFTPKGVQWLAAEIAKHHAAKQMKALAA